MNELSLCERFGWELDYVERLGPATQQRILRLLDARDKGMAWHIRPTSQMQD